MSPEQCLGFECDARSDIYSLGCIMYESVAGRCPFVETNHIQTIVSHLNTAPAPLSSIINAKVPQSLNHVILWTLEKDPGARHQTAFDLRKDLELVGAGTPPKFRKIERFSCAKAWLLMAAITVALTFLAFWQHSQCTNQVITAQATCDYSSGLANQFHDAKEAILNYSKDKDPVFDSYFDEAARKMLGNVSALKRVAGDNKMDQESVAEISATCSQELQTLKQARNDFDHLNDSVRAARSRQLYKDSWGLGDRLYHQLLTLVERHMQVIRDRDWLARADAIFAVELLAILLVNAAIAEQLIRRQRRLNRSLLWINQKQKK